MYIFFSPIYKKNICIVLLKKIWKRDLFCTIECVNCTVVTFLSGNSVDITNEMDLHGGKIRLRKQLYAPEFPGLLYLIVDIWSEHVDLSHSILV